MFRIPDKSTPARSRNPRRWKIRMPSFSLGGVIRWGILLSLAAWVLYNYLPDIALNQLKERYAYPDSRFVTVEGMPVHYRIAGKGEPIVLLHDANNSLASWEGWIDSLSKHFLVIAPDLPGYGLTGPHPRGSYSTFMYVNFLQQFADSLHLKQFHLAGNGLGAQISWFYAMEHPERLRKMILLNAPGFEKSKFSLIQFIARTPVINRALWRITPRSVFRIGLENNYADDSRVTEVLLQRHYELFLRPGNRKAFTDAAQVRENRPPAEMIDNLNVSTLILWGAEDARISPEFAYEFHKRIRKSQLKIYQNTGHWPQEENPAVTARDARSFLEGRF